MVYKKLRVKGVWPRPPCIKLCWSALRGWRHSKDNIGCHMTNVSFQTQGGGESTPYEYSLYGQAQPERGSYFRV